jgi:hypothetical protein
MEKLIIQKFTHPQHSLQTPNNEKKVNATQFLAATRHFFLLKSPNPPPEPAVYSTLPV